MNTYILSSSLVSHLSGDPSKRRRGNRTLICAFLVCSAALLHTPARGSEIFSFVTPAGLAGEAEFTLLGPTTLEIRLRNLSTDVPDGFTSADQLITGVSWDFGGGIAITGGSAETGSASESVNFDNVVSQLGPNEDASGEYGYGNGGGSENLPNFVSGNTAGATAFGGANLDGPVNINGPQAGLVSQAMPVNLGGLGAVKDELLFTVTLSGMLDNLDFLNANGVRFEFGSDARVFTLSPEPTSAVLMILGIFGLIGARYRRRTAT